MAFSSDFVACYLIPSSVNSADYNRVMTEQNNKIAEFLATQKDSGITKIFIESGKNIRYRHDWRQLTAAINFCLEQKLNLLIPKIHTLMQNEHFSKEILRFIESSESEIICCDDLLINKQNFPALAKRAQELKEAHSKLIHDGLNRTSAKLGNPKALDIIKTINEPKIKKSILFALQLAPIIADYKAQGYSQRDMVNALNKEGFTAPEGGHWVLSQFQKVLDRIKLNEAALKLENEFQEFQSRNVDPEEICKIFIENNRPCPIEKNWTPHAVAKIQERLSQIHDIIHFHKLGVELIPIIKKHPINELTDSMLNNELESAHNKDTIRALLKKLHEPTPRLLQQLSTLLQTSTNWHKTFSSNPLYLPHLDSSRARDNTLTQLISSQRELEPFADNLFNQHRPIEPKH